MTSSSQQTAVGQSTVQALPWQRLLQRLERDNLADAKVKGYFAALPPYSSAPMGAKIRELFGIAFSPKKPKDPAAQRMSEKTRKSRVYKGVVSTKSLAACKDFMQANKAAFASMEKKYHVPKDIVASLLYVETRLGGFLGNESAFLILASMAASDAPDMLRHELSDVPLKAEHAGWLQKKLTERSTWAYNELKALLVHCLQNDIDPLTVPGSMYGAIGLCQFMPSNIAKFAVDGDNDGVVDLFTPADAIHSVGAYLAGNGWKKGLTMDAQRKVLRRYNNLTIYANTILALSASVRTGVVYKAPSDVWSPAPKKSGKKNPAVSKATGAKKQQGKGRRPASGSSSQKKSSKARGQQSAKR